MAGKTKTVAEIKDNVVYVTQAGTPVFAKTADICAMTGKTNQWIGQLVSQGVISKKQTPHGAMFDVAQTILAYCAMLEDRSEDEEDKKLDKQKREADTIFKKSKATMASLEAKERMGKMHRSEDVAALTEDLIYTIRGELLALPGRLAVDVMSAKDTAEASDIIRREVYAIMEELSNYKYDASKYEERVRERLKLSAVSVSEENEES